MKLAPVKIEFWGQEFTFDAFWACLGGFVIAVVSSMFGFGGGPFIVPLMCVGLGLPMYVTAASSLLAIFFNTFIASVRHYQFGNFDLILFLVSFPAAFLGANMGPRLAAKVSPIWVKRAAVLGLSILALSLLGVF